MANTTNFGWETPDDTDLVKDGAAAMRTLGNAIDTSFVDLKGGTTGQVLAKASNTDLDFTWATDASGIPATIFDAKGDLIAASAADTAARLAVGTNGYFLSADSAETTGLKWVPAPAAGANWTLLNTGGTALTAATTITVSGISADKILILVEGASAGAGDTIFVRVNGDSGSNYRTGGPTWEFPTTYSQNNYSRESGLSSLISIATLSSNAGSTASGYVHLTGCNASGVKIYQSAGGASPSSGNGQGLRVFGGVYSGSSVISNVSVISTGSNFDAGTVYVYTSA
jgi:hypothetical protein